ncbi:hypothetical protein NW762_007597 [Fusarium torreyae]|uniref:F-box domain-containing protein n=1 Tax=Fusarium torreyae TaxID=1237075 RepID=A0A9W8VCY3_9HYPO|nr:hypothetical protein NW762_007597 [Fusarium torreyae]
MIYVPDEIWGSIFSYFHYKISEHAWESVKLVDGPSTETLRSLSRVCKQFRRIANGFNYRNISIEAAGSIPLVARSLKNDPQLGQITRQLSLQTVEDPPTGDFLRGFSKAVATLNSLPPKLKGAILNELEHLVNDEQTSRESLQTLILATTPHVRVADLLLNSRSQLSRWLLSGTLDKNGDYNPKDFGDDDTVASVQGSRGSDTFENPQDTEPSGDMKNQVVPQALYLHDLKELRLNISKKSSGASMSQYEGLLLLPNLKFLRLTRFEWLSHTSHNMRWGSVPSHLTKLDLVDCMLEPASLRQILTRCKSLSYLSIDFAGTLSKPARGGQFYSINLQLFGDVLRELGQNLTELVFTTINFEKYCGVTEERKGKLGSLEELTSLRHLTVSRQNLVGPRSVNEDHQIKLVDALPPSLQTLELVSEDTNPLQFIVNGRMGTHNDWPEYFRETDHQVVIAIVTGLCPDLHKVIINRYGQTTKVWSCRFDSVIGGWHVEEQRIETQPKFNRVEIRANMRTIITRTE